MAKYMLIMRSTDESLAAMMETPMEQMIEVVGSYNDELIKAGVLVAAEGLDDAAQGVVVDFTGATPVVTDGPYPETQEVLAGYWIVECDSVERATEIATRLTQIPDPRGVNQAAVVDVRPLADSQSEIDF